MEHILQTQLPQDQVIRPLTRAVQTTTSEVFSLDAIFDQQQFEDKNIQKAKQILGSVADSYESDELRDVVTEIQFLVENWLDTFERTIFDGLTLKEMLHEKGGV